MPLPFRVSTLLLRDYRGLSAVTIHLHNDRLAVFVGVNGSGKTSVLDGAASLLSWLVARVRSPQGRGFQIPESDIRNESPLAVLTIILEAPGWGLENEPLIWGVGKWRAGRRRDEGMEGTRLEALRPLAEAVREGLTEHPAEASVPLVALYPVNRAVLDIPLRIKKAHRFDQLGAYEGALERATSNFRLFFEWFRGREDIENEARLEAPAYRDRELSAVRRAVESLMPGFKGLRVRRTPLRMTVDKGRETLRVDQLSDGEKCVLALVGDLARRLALANPALDDPLQGSGIVMIDEVELHLHPGWQRRVVPGLLAAFPNCQFLLTTHSPAVLSEVPNDAVFLLERDRAGALAVRPLDTYGRDVNTILEDVFDAPTRPKRVRQALDRLFADLHAGRLDAAQKRLRALEPEIGRDDPALIRARAQFEARSLLNG